MTQTTFPFAMLSARQTEKFCGISRSTRYNLMKETLFPRPVMMLTNKGAYPAYEVEAMNAARVAGKSNEEIKELVIQLENDRKSAFDQQSMRWRGLKMAPQKSVPASEVTGKDMRQMNLMLGLNDNDREE
jgi:prophage regulatory protein